MVRVPSLLLLFSVTLLTLCHASEGNENCTSCTASHTPGELRQLRLEQLKQNILAQLGYTEPPEAPADAGPPPAPSDLDIDILDDYEQLTSTTAATSEAKCISGDFYAKPINSFIGVLSPVEGLGARHRRGANDMSEWYIPEEDTTAVEDVILNQYTITVDFSLPHNLSDISEARLTLYQEEANTIDHPVLDRYQLVQIRTVIDNIRYFVEKKIVDVYGFGLQSFDIKRAVELWVQEEVSGSVILEILVSCYSSPNCSSVDGNGIIPAKVSFVEDTSDLSTVPRIITVSRNPLEVEERARAKRHTSSETPDQYCVGNDSLCCLHPLTINFTRDLGINFISKPPTFRANFCDGFCPEVSGTGLLTSQRFQLLRYLNSSPTRAIKPCCSGIEYKPLQVLVTLYNPREKRYETHLDVLEQVIVTKCRCG